MIGGPGSGLSIGASTATAAATIIVGFNLTQIRWSYDEYYTLESTMAEAINA